ncbi:MAG TPA: SemiSWEET transporter [Chitinophagaceae bacterium]|nr:SemiSWEET transporter [Chitinophagaceae bacterium]
MDEVTNYVGIGAGIFTGISMLPQLIKIIREKKAEDISFVMLLVLMVGLAGWIWYGIRKEDWPLIVTNAFSFTVNALMAFFSFKYKSNTQQKSAAG